MLDHPMIYAVCFVSVFIYRAVVMLRVSFGEGPIESTSEMYWGFCFVPPTKICVDRGFTEASIRSIDELITPQAAALYLVR